MRPYDKIHCDKCGADIAENWWIQHVRSDCQRGLPDNSTIHRANHLKEKIAKLQMTIANLSEQMSETIHLVMEIEEEATERKINTVAHLPEQRQYEQGRADAARAILAMWIGNKK